MTITIVLADDHPIIRTGLKMALATDPDIEVVGEANDGDETQSLVAELLPNILLLDIDMPGPKVTDTISFVQSESPKTKVIILTAYDDDAYVRAVMRVGVAGYLLKEEADDTIAKAVRAVNNGAAWYSQSIADKFLQWQFGYEPEIEGAHLTSREKDLLALIAKGWDNIRIAKELCLAEQTVRNYTSTLYEKLDLHSRSEAVIWAREHGFLEKEI